MKLISMLVLTMLAACSTPAAVGPVAAVRPAAQPAAPMTIRVTIAEGEIRVGERRLMVDDAEGVIEPLVGELVRARTGAEGGAVVDVVAEPQTPFRLLARVIRTAEVAGVKHYRLGTVAVEGGPAPDITVTVTSAGYLISVGDQDRAIPTRSGGALSHRLQVVRTLLRKAAVPGNAELGLIAHELLDDAQEEYDTASLYNLLASLRALRPDARTVKVVADDDIPAQFVTLTLDAIGFELASPDGAAFRTQAGFKLAQYAAADTDRAPLFDTLVVSGQ
jgi:hypothetical protein